MKVYACVVAAALAVGASAFNYERSHFIRMRRDLSTDLDHEEGAKDMYEAENHDKPKVPHGSQLISIPVEKKSKVDVYWSYYANDEKTERAYIMMHGKWRDGGEYWQVMNDAYQSALKSGFDGLNNRTIIAAPEFYSKKLNKGQYQDNTLAWDDPNTWQAGEAASHPKGTGATAFDALDAIVEHFANKDKFPSLKNITIVGHGGGAQLINRYAAVGTTPDRDGLHIRYVIGDPSSSPYFTKDRPELDNNDQSKDGCKGYNTWRYGFDKFSGTERGGKKSPKDYFKQYISRDVVNLIGYDDTKSNGDQKCMAILQGGKKRRDRNLTWWRYINQLARTSERLDGFPNKFKNLPDWSDVSKNTINTRLVVVPHGSHDAEDVLTGKYGQSALFSNKDVKTGWRPKGWKAAKPPKGGNVYVINSNDADNDNHKKLHRDDDSDKDSDDSKKGSDGSDKNSSNGSGGAGANASSSSSSSSSPSSSSSSSSPSSSSSSGSPSSSGSQSSSSSPSSSGSQSSSNSKSNSGNSSSSDASSTGNSDDAGNSEDDDESNDDVDTQDGDDSNDSQDSSQTKASHEQSQESSPSSAVSLLPLGRLVIPTIIIATAFIA